MTDLEQETSRLPLAVLRLRGSQAEMGEQFGRLTFELGGWEPMLDFYPLMPSYLLSSGAPQEYRAVLSAMFRHLLFAPATAMNAYRQRRFPEYYARTVAMAEVAGVPARLARHLMVMDVFQNVVGLVGRLGLLRATQLAAGCGGCCSTLAVWGGASTNGRLLHARNFDFPGAGLWDEAPTVVFCEPDEGLRYGYVSSRGVDLPGVTAFNEAGLTMTAHTRYHRDVSFRAASIIDLGHEIIRRATTLDEAVNVAAEFRVASSWGLLISSAREADALVLETTASSQQVVRPSPGREFLACTNRYLSSALQDGEITAATVFSADSDARYARLEQVAARGARSGGLDSPELQALLGDLDDPGAAPGAKPATRIVGNCISSPVSVTSVVCDAGRQQVQVSVGRAPTGWGPYLTIPWQWDGPVEARLSPVPKTTAERPPRLPCESVRRAYRRYVELCRRHLACESAPQLGADVRALARQHRDEPHFQFLAAVTSMQQGDLASAAVALERALDAEGGAYRRAQYLLWLSRVHDALGASGDAANCRAILGRLSHPWINEYQQLAQQEHTRPYSGRRLRRVSINMMAIDAE